MKLKIVDSFGLEFIISFGGKHILETPNILDESFLCTLLWCLAIILTVFCL